MRSKLEPVLKKELPTAKRVYVATALINAYGYKLIVENLAPEAKIHFLIGINLPSDAGVLETLFQQQSETLQSRIYNGRNYFHPKVYLLEAEDGQRVAYVGSANTTAGGLLSNLEMSAEVRDQQVCLELLHWFRECWDQGAEITEAFLAKYRQKLKNIKKRESSNRSDVAGLKRLLKAAPAVSHKNEAFDLPFFSPENFASYAHENRYDYRPEADAKRYAVRQKFKELHNRIYRQFSDRNMTDLYAHDHAPSLISHYQYREGFNKKELKSMWLHYGYHKSDYRNKFGNHPRLQVILHYDNLSVWLVVGKEYGSSTERGRFKVALSDVNFRNYVFSLFMELGEAFGIYSNGWRERKISDFSNADDFAQYLLGEKLEEYFLISRWYSPGDIEISDANITKTVLAEFERLHPLYLLFRSFKIA